MGVRIAASGHLGVFVNGSCGKGLMPLDYVSFRTQRYRWAFGGAQILKKHWSKVLWVQNNPACHGFNVAQRLGFGLFFLFWFEAWLAVGIAFLFWLTAVLYFASPELIRTSVPASCATSLVALMCARKVLFAASLMRRSQCTLPDAWGAFLVLSSVNWLVSCACMRALFSRTAAFQRTPKDQPSQETLIRKMRCIKAELTLSACGLGASCAPLLGGVTKITVIYWIGCLWGSAMFSAPLFVLALDHAQRPLSEMGTGVYDLTAMSELGSLSGSTPLRHNQRRRVR